MFYVEIDGIKYCLGVDVARSTENDLQNLISEIISDIEELELELDSPEEQCGNDEAFINHYVELLMENAKCKNCTRDILMNFMDEIIYKMN
jgi:hypothetical protein